MPFAGLPFNCADQHRIIITLHESDAASSSFSDDFIEFRLPIEHVRSDFGNAIVCRVGNDDR